MKAKNKLVVQIKKEAKNVVLILRETYQKSAQVDFAEYLRKADVSENGQVYCERFLRNRRHETYCYNNKSR